MLQINLMLKILFINTMRYKLKKIWTWIFGISLSLNVLCLGLFAFAELNKHFNLTNESKLKEIIKNELQFDKYQSTLFSNLVDAHQFQSAIIREEIVNAKKTYYQFEKPNQQALETLINNYRKLDSLNYTHFRDVRALCKGDQIKIFDELVLNIITHSNFGFNGRKKNR